MFRRFSFLLTKPSIAYQQMVAAGTLTRDENQMTALPAFDRLYEDLEAYVAKGKIKAHPKREVELRPSSGLGVVPSFFFRREQEKKVKTALNNSTSKADDFASYHPLSHVKGLYIYGGVGCGKTMMMDLLYNNAPAEIKKARIHFHQFMLDVQKTSHNIRYKSKGEIQDSLNRKSMVSGSTSDNLRRNPAAETDIFDEIAQRLISNVELLCFDEVAVADVADAMIMRRLFNAFYKIGVVVVYTSNRPPDDLYLGGLNRESFLPFIEMIKKLNIVHHMPSNIDHRLTGQKADVYFSPMNHENDEAFQKMFLECCKGMPPKPKTLKVFGRDVDVNMACGGVCYFDFTDICGSAMSTADYEVIAKSFHTIFIKGVPRFAYESSDIKMRFLVLIDTLYEHHCKPVIYAEVEPALLQEDKTEFHGRVGAGEDGKVQIAFEHLSEFEKETGKKLIADSDSTFQMDRCISRLYEMRSKEYLQAPHIHEDVNISSGMH